MDNDNFGSPTRFGELLPPYPQFDDQVWQECAETDDYVPIFFEWYKWVGSCVNLIAFIQPDSPAFKKGPILNYYVLSGHLARIVHLILATLRLTADGQFGDAAFILHRCLAESATKVQWACNSSTEERVRQLVLDGLKAELELEDQIETNIARFNGPNPLEERMKRSIEKCFVTANVSREDVRNRRRLPDLASMMTDLGLVRLQYTVQQRMMSHFVHGNWPVLCSSYLEENKINEFEYGPRGTSEPPHINMYMSGAEAAIGAAKAYARNFFQDYEANLLDERLDEARENMMDAYLRTVSLSDPECLERSPQG